MLMEGGIRIPSVPPSAIVRFAHALGFGGFTEMQQVFRSRLVAGAGGGRGLAGVRGSRLGLRGAQSELSLLLRSCTCLLIGSRFADSLIQCFTCSLACLLFAALAHPLAARHDCCDWTTASRRRTTHGT